MATKGGEERKGEAVPVPVVIVAIYPPLSKDNPGMASLVARGGGEMRELEIVPVTGASGLVRSTKETARWVSLFVFFHGAVAFFVFLMLNDQNADYFGQCMEACPVLTNVEFYIAQLQFHHIVHVTMLMCSAVQILAASLAMVSTGRPRRAASFVALCIAVATGMLSIHLVYTGLFGRHCCFSGGNVQVAFAVAVALCQAAIPAWGGWVAYGLAHPPCREQ